MANRIHDPHRMRPWLALAVALLPALVTHAAYALSIRDGHAPACLPYWDGCTSISRAARHGSGNVLFKAVMLPVALALAVLWWQVRDAGSRRAGAVAWLGIAGAASLALYVAFLGAEADVARSLRRHGAVLYFACTFLAQCLYVRRRWRRGCRDAATRMLLVCCVLLLAGGLASTAASALMSEAGLKDRLENAIEWCLGALFTLWFLGLAVLGWRHRNGPMPARH